MTTGSLLAYQQATAQAQTTVAKGEALATFLKQVFIQLDGVSVTESNVFSDDHSQEVDIVLWNEKRDGVTGASFLPFIVFVEAKNWDKPVGAAEVAWFKEKIIQGGDFSGVGAVGVLVAPKGVTGNHRDARFAAAVILRARSEKVRIVVATPEELALEADGLRAFLQRRLSELASGKAGLPT